MLILKNKYNKKGFSLQELIGVILSIFFFSLGFLLAQKLPQWQEQWDPLVRFYVRIACGIILFFIFVFSCMAIGAFLQKRKKINKNG
jgi:hypothetical protein